MTFNHLTMYLRQWKKQPGFSWVVIFTLALGIRASTAIFSFVSAVLIQPSPFKNPDRLALIQSEKGGELEDISLREIQNFLEKTYVFEDVAAFREGAQYNVSGDGEPEELSATLCTYNLLSVLGVSPEEGASWPAEMDTRRSFNMVLSHALWKKRYEKHTSVFDKPITLDASPTYTVHGVMPDGYNFPYNVAMYRSITIIDAQATRPLP